MKLIVLLIIACSFSFCSCEAKTKDNAQFENIFNGDNKENSADLSKKDGYMRFLCYNVRHCNGMDNVINYDRIAAVIAGFDADFVALQELDSVTTRSNMVNQVEVLGQKLGMHSYFGAAIPYRGGKYGLGILSKQPALKTYVYALPGVENRAVLVAEYADFLIMSVHLDLTESHRVESVGIITNIVKQFNKKAYLAGDFNEDLLDGSMFTAFNKDWTIVSPIKNTFPTGKPSKCIDFVITYNGGGEYDINKGDVIYSLPEVNVSVASDHYPLYVDFK